MKIDNDYKEKLFSKETMRRAFPLFLAIAASIVFYLLITKIGVLFDFIGRVLSILQPVIIGLVIAYLVNPIVCFVRSKLYPFLSKKIKNEKAVLIISKSVAVFCGMAVFLGIVAVICILIIPNLISSITNILGDIRDNYPAYIENINRMFGEKEYLTNFVSDAFGFINTQINNGLIDNITRIAETVSTAAIGVFGFAIDTVVGIMVAVYALYNKDLFKAQTKKVLYAVFKKETVSDILTGAAKTNEVFGGFITGKVIDSFIIGVLCFVGVTILGFNNSSVLVATIIGVTNIIPFFGPFIGGIPSALIVWVAEGDFKKCIYFAIFIVLLQQLDGNVIGPKILGNRTGLSSFWVIVAIVVFGGFFGVIGMLIGVPCFAVIYFFVSYFIRKGLRKKGLPVDSASYMPPPYTEPVKTEKKKKSSLFKKAKKGE